MRIAQVAPLSESVPPQRYGGTERVVSYLTEELVRAGHDVTLFASGDSQTRARLVPVCQRGLRLNPTFVDAVPHSILLVERVFQQAGDFDIIHFHTEPLQYPLVRLSKVPAVTTLHGRLDLPDLVPLYSEFREMALVSISMAQRTPLPWLNWAGTVYHGLPSHLYPFHPQPGRYLAFLGRISPEKQPDHAIHIARRANLELKIAAKVDPVDNEYFHTRIQPLLVEPGIDFVGEISECEKGDFLGNARALLFPVGWPEPFGLVMIEALACGTPVIAYGEGSVPEVIEDGITGFVVADVAAAVEAVGCVESLDRRACRQAFLERFSVERMSRDYVRIYRRLACGD